MNDLNKHYEISRNKATLFMKNGQLGAYFNALIEMNRYKKLIRSVAAN
jgi:hypothetical protein